MDIEHEGDLDRQDMDQLAAGRPEALDRLMGRHGPRLYHFLLRQTRSQQEAADLAQESFVRVFLNCSQYRSRYRFSTWLYTIALNLRRDRQRRRARRPEVPLEPEIDSGDRAWDKHTADPQANPREALETKEQVRAVQEAVARLPEEFRQVLLLAEYEDQSHKEIAAILRCSPKAVEMRLYRARQLLRDWLSPLLSRSP